MNRVKKTMVNKQIKNLYSKTALNNKYRSRSDFTHRSGAFFPGGYGPVGDNSEKKAVVVQQFHELLSVGDQFGLYIYMGTQTEELLCFSPFSIRQTVPPSQTNRTYDTRLGKAIRRLFDKGGQHMLA